MARPTIDSKDKRTIRFTFRMNEREEELLNRLIIFSNCSGADVIRNLVFKERLLQPKITILDQKTYGELKRIGTNINQIAKKLNADVQVTETTMTLNELKNTLDFILQHLLHDR